MRRSFASKSTINDFISKNDEVVRDLDNFKTSADNVIDDLLFEVDKKYQKVSDAKDKLDRLISQAEDKLSRAESNLSAAVSQNAATPSTITVTKTDSQGNTTTSTKNSELTSNTVSTSTVYITNTGSKYHNAGCRYLGSSKISINESDAKSRGYTPCSVCH